MKTRIITWLVTFGAFLDTAYGVLSENQGLLVELGISPKTTKVIMLVGLLWTAFSKSLSPKVEAQSIGGSNPPPGKDEK